MPVPEMLRRMPKRYADIQLPEPYDIFTIRAWTNFGRDMERRLWEDSANAFAEVIESHNLVDFDGNPYPPAQQLDTYREENGEQISNKDGFWSVIPEEVGIVLYRAIRGEVGKLPNASGRGR